MTANTAVAMPLSMSATPNASAQAMPVRERVSAAEWNARVELAALYRLVAHFGWTDTIYNHISLRVPDEEAFLINPFGYFYEEITASSLVKINVKGEVLDDPTRHGINRAGFVIHGAIHAARHDVACVIHTHTRAGTAVAAQEHGLLPISQNSTVFIGRTAYHDFEGVALNEEEQARLIDDLGNHRVMILRNHGLLTAGRSAGEALVLMITLERACEIQIAAMSGGAQLRYITQESIDFTQRILDGLGLAVDRDWEAMLRLAHKIGPDFCD